MARTPCRHKKVKTKQDLEREHVQMTRNALFRAENFEQFHYENKNFAPYFFNMLEEIDKYRSRYGKDNDGIKNYIKKYHEGYTDERELCFDVERIAVALKAYVDFIDNIYKNYFKRWMFN